MKKLLVWDSSVYDMKNGRKFGGIAVQLNIWMETFIKEGWEVHAITTQAPVIDKAGIHYHKIRHIRKVDLIYDWVVMYSVINKVRPKLIIVRGAQRAIYPLAKVAHMFNAKLLMFGASDINFVKGKANVGNRINQILYEMALRKSVDYFVTQNHFQAETLQRYFSRNSLTLLNIWKDRSYTEKNTEKLYDVIWVSNIRRLKRAEWLLNAAKQLPQYRFAIIGGSNDAEYYDEIKKASQRLDNVDFLGHKPLAETSNLINRSKILVCTSEYEGFPNTFLQAWSNEIPVISTVDPNDIIVNNKIGCKISDNIDLKEHISLLLNDLSLYNEIVLNIRSYFRDSHSASKAFLKLMSYIII